MPRSLFSWKNILLVVVVIGLLLLWKNRNMFLAASVNGNSITRNELNGYLMRRFGKQGLDNLINEQLIVSGAKQKGITVSADEITAKMKEIETRLAGQTTLKDAMEAQGMDEEMFRRQLEIQLSIEKLFQNEASISAVEIDDYLKKNPDVAKQSTDTAKLREDIQASLKQQKITEKFDAWFQDLKNKAAIQSYL